jgi:hypothetical protein
MPLRKLCVMDMQRNSWLKPTVALRPCLLGGMSMKQAEVACARSCLFLLDDLSN